MVRQRPFPHYDLRHVPNDRNGGCEEKGHPIAHVAARGYPNEDLLGLAMILTGALLSGGCATKKYVQQTTVPIQSKLDQVADQTNKQGTSIEAAQKDIERHETGINATKGLAMSGEKAANDAMNAAKTADQAANEARTMASQNARQIKSLQQTLGNLDDYTLQAETVVPFGFNKDELTPEGKEQVDQLVTAHSNSKRYFVTIEGLRTRLAPIAKMTP